MVGRTVEGSHGRLTVAAGRGCRPRIEDELREGVALPRFLENGRPHVFRGFERHGGEFCELFLFGRAAVRRIGSIRLRLSLGLRGYGKTHGFARNQRR